MVAPLGVHRSGGVLREDLDATITAQEDEASIRPGSYREPRMKKLLVLASLFFLLGLLLAADPLKPVKVFILAGQSNMEGKAKVSLLEYQAEQPDTRDLFRHLRKDGQWIEREDVWIKFLDRKGNLT